jgi:hypothetical protein
MLYAPKIPGGGGLAALTLSIALAQCVVAADSTPTASVSEGWARALARLDALDPQSPATLNARLAYADVLTRSTNDCRRRLDTAQTQLDIARASPAAEVVLASAAAREAAVDYDIHAERAACVSDDAERERELRAALAAAQHAVELYRDAFDAVAMTTMQYNTGVAYRQLKDEPASVAALEATIALDREFGFRDDALENYPLLLRWRGEGVTPEKITELMRDFPQRSIKLNFSPAEGDVPVRYTADYARLLDGVLVKAGSRRSAVQHIVKRGRRWSLTYRPSAVDYVFDAFPGRSEQLDRYLLSLSRMLFNFHDLWIDADGSFDRGIDAPEFDRRVLTDARALATRLQQAAPSISLRKGFDHAAYFGLLHDLREAQLAEDYNLAAGTWLGAELDQGVWYEMSARLSMPVAPQLFVLQHVEFAYTRTLPCSVDAAERVCVELVVRAKPDPDSLQTLLDEVRGAAHLPRRVGLRSSWSTEMRLVVDPASLRPYLRDTRQHTYIAQDDAPHDAVMESQRTVYVYGEATP